jgi:hypothetical protein
VTKVFFVGLADKYHSVRLEMGHKFNSFKEITSILKDLMTLPNIPEYSNLNIFDKNCAQYLAQCEKPTPVS